jgi:nitrogen fixation protein FixH
MEPSRSNSGHSWLPRLGFFLLIVCTCATTVASQSDDRQSRSQSQSSDADKSSNSEKKDKNADPPTVKLRIEVSGPNGKPVGNASVYVRFNQPGGTFHKDKLAELNMKTNEDGSVKVPEVPQGKILIQVIAKNLHTFGKWYDIQKDAETIQIKLDPPPHWY